MQNTVKPINIIRNRKNSVKMYATTKAVYGIEHTYKKSQSFSEMHIRLMDFSSHNPYQE